MIRCNTSGNDHAEAVIDLVCPTCIFPFSNFKLPRHIEGFVNLQDAFYLLLRQEAPFVARGRSQRERAGLAAVQWVIDEYPPHIEPGRWEMGLTY
jgi:hypothetical protein